MASSGTSSSSATSACPSQFILPHDYSGCRGDDCAFLFSPPKACLAEDVCAYPLEPAVKSERLGRVCDFASTGPRGYYGSAAARELAAQQMLAAAEAALQEFRLVDSRPMKSTTTSFVNRFQQRNKQQRLLQQQQQQIQQAQQRGGFSAKISSAFTQQQQRQMAVQQQRQQQRQQQAHKNNRLRQFAEWSIEPQPDWQCVDIKQLDALAQVTLDASKVEFEDIAWRGELRQYQRQVDRLLPKHNATLNYSVSKDLTFYWASTEDDSILMDRFENDESITVAATDQLLACLMAAYHSKLSWHIIFLKQGDRILVSKDEGTSVDLLTVDETHRDPPLTDAPLKVNKPLDLAAEAMRINQAFSQQVLTRSGEPVRKYEDAPFVESTHKPASKLYRYRILTLPPISTSPNAPESSRKPIRVITRVEIDGTMNVPAEDDGKAPVAGELVAVKALNEYSPARSSKPWKDALETQRGALLALETKNNHGKVGKWVSQAILGGVPVMKFGFVTRANRDNNDKHRLLTVLSSKVSDLSAQIGLREGSAFGVLRLFLSTVLQQEDGKFILVKDPVKPQLKLFKLPLNE